jgi:hypothetical protein
MDVSTWDRYNMTASVIRDADNEFNYVDWAQTRNNKQKQRRVNMKNYKTVIGAAVAGLTLAAVSSQAQLNLTGGTVVGSLVDQTLGGISPGSNVGADNGSVSSWVISGAAADTTGLIFVYQIVNSGPDAVDNAEFTGFNAGQVLSSGAFAGLTGLAFGSTPTEAGWSGAATIFGGTATWEAGDLNTGGAISDYLAVLTNVQYFSGDYGQIQDSFSAQGSILAPVPEANTVVAGALMLLPLGIGAARALRKERTA